MEMHRKQKGAFRRRKSGCTPQPLLSRYENLHKQLTLNPAAGIELFQQNKFFRVSEITRRQFIKINSG